MEAEVIIDVDLCVECGDEPVEYDSPRRLCEICWHTWIREGMCNLKGCDNDTAGYRNIKTKIGEVTVPLCQFHIEQLEPPLDPEGPDRDYHTEHCCVGHGCKVGYDDCPVVKRLKVQSFPCESCEER